MRAASSTTKKKRPTSKNKQSKNKKKTVTYKDTAFFVALSIGCGRCFDVFAADWTFDCIQKSKCSSAFLGSCAEFRCWRQSPTLNKVTHLSAYPLTSKLAILTTFFCEKPALLPHFPYSDVCKLSEAKTYNYKIYTMPPIFHNHMRTRPHSPTPIYTRLHSPVSTHR